MTDGYIIDPHPLYDSNSSNLDRCQALAISQGIDLTNSLAVREWCKARYRSGDLSVRTNMDSAVAIEADAFWLEEPDAAPVDRLEEYIADCVYDSGIVPHDPIFAAYDPWKVRCRELARGDGMDVWDDDALRDWLMARYQAGDAEVRCGLDSYVLLEASYFPHKVWRHPLADSIEWFSMEMMPWGEE